MKVQMPKEARYIIETLMQHGYEAYIVGGCVRDSILGKEPQDWDITTSATPEQTKALFRRTIDTGIEHGTVTVMMDKVGYEVTTYRVDGKYEDHRRPKEVTFTASLLEDLKRRDFTINAMAYNDVEGIVDEFDGIGDLQKGIIRCVGVPQERFDEDALRILRAVRFAAQLNFAIEEETCQAIREKAEFLRDISAERIQVELTKLITSRNPERLINAYELGITKIVLPEFDAMMETEQNNIHHCYNVGEHSVEVMKHIDPQPILRWAALLHDVAKPMCRTTDETGVDHFYNHQKEGRPIAHRVLRRMKLDNDTIHTVERLVEWHDYALDGNITKKSLRKALNQMGPDLFDNYRKLRWADMMGQSDYRRQEKIEAYERLVQMQKEIMDASECLSIKELKIDGKKLIQLGVQPGPAMGEILHYLLEQVLEQPELNSEEILTQLALKYYQEQTQ
ncbi:MAG: CCA tRNA nucleotidyltransferase [Lachnospiraceae bacterium]|nr:CCA tRNA nucleotidyltransferase [Lachnospiraceae bacterium]